MTFDGEILLAPGGLFGRSFAPSMCSGSLLEAHTLAMAVGPLPSCLPWLAEVTASVGNGKAVLWRWLVPKLHARQRLNMAEGFQAPTLSRQIIAMIGSLADGVGTLHPCWKAATKWW